MIELNKIYCGDALEVLKTFPTECVDCCITSPPYWGLRDYGVEGQLGLENTPVDYVNNMIIIFNEVKRVLKKQGTLWLNLGDSYASDTKGTGGPSEKQDSNAGSRYKPYKLNHGLKSKDLVGIPWRVAFALQAQGWYLRSDIIWHKPNPMPESVIDRPTKAHEYIFLMAKSAKYYYNDIVISEPLQGKDERQWADNYDNVGSILQGESNAGIKRTKRYSDKYDTVPRRKRRSVWTVPTYPYPEAHFATFPEKLIEPCVLAGCPEGGVILDPFGGSGAVAKVALRARRNFVLIELNKDYCAIAERRIKAERDQTHLF
jgi:DNA modification methylase